MRDGIEFKVIKIFMILIEILLFVCSIEALKSFNIQRKSFRLYWNCCFLMAIACYIRS